MVVSRSATICEIDTFMTLLSSTITNCAAARTAIGSHTASPWGAGGDAADRSRTVTVSPQRRSRPARARLRLRVQDARRLGGELGVGEDPLLLQAPELLEVLDARVARRLRRRSG